jgi:hypothetical protein
MASDTDLSASAVWNRPLLGIKHELANIFSPEPGANRSDKCGLVYGDLIQALKVDRHPSVDNLIRYL